MASVLCSVLFRPPFFFTTVSFSSPCCYLLTAPVPRLCWQTENGVLLPSLQSALPFLDLHGTPRLEFHQSVFDELREKLLERVSAIALEGKVEERSVGSLVICGERGISCEHYLQWASGF